MPSHAPWGRVLTRLKPQHLQACCLAWTPAVAQRMQGTRVSLDGTTVPASCERATARAPLHRRSAWGAEQGGLVAGHRNTDTPSPAMTALPALLQLRAITGCLVPREALGGQTARAEHIRAHGGDDRLA